MNNETFKDVKIGDKLWSFKSGWGQVIDTNYSNTYPLQLQFQDGDNSFSLDGKDNESDLLPDLYYDEIKFEIPKKPLPKLAVDTKVLVGSNKTKGYFSHFNDEGKLCAFYNGKTSWTANGGTSYWDTWELADDTPKV